MRVYKSEDLIKSGNIIGIFSREEHRPEERHSHDFIEVVYILSGNATQWVDEQAFEVCRGDVIFINYGAVHAFLPQKEFHYVNICFMPEVLSNGIITPDNALALLSLTAFDELRRDKNGGMLSFSGEERAVIEFLLQDMLREYQEGLPLSGQVLESYLRVLFSRMLRKLLVEESSTETGDIWRDLISYIDENLHEELSLSALAQKSFYNPSYFSRIFKQKLGVSLTDYIRQKRMELAMRLLRETDLTVDEIIERTGYKERSAFYHAFSRCVGTAPVDYRARMRSQR